MEELGKGAPGSIQFTGDAFVPYTRAVEDTFRADVDCGQLVKVFSNQVENG